MTLPAGRAARPRGALACRRQPAGDAAARSASAPTTTGCVYGEYAGLSNFDRRVHTNNMYIEMLVGGRNHRGRRVRVVVLGRRQATCRRGAGITRHGARAGGWSDRRRDARDRTARPGRLVPRLHRRLTFCLLSLLV